MPDEVSRSPFPVFAVAAAILAACISIVFLFCFRAYVMPTGSMEDTMLIGDHFLVRVFPHSTPQRDQIIVFRMPPASGRPQSKSRRTARRPPSNAIRSCVPKRPGTQRAIRSAQVQHDGQIQCQFSRRIRPTTQRALVPAFRKVSTRCFGTSKPGRSLSHPADTSSWVTTGTTPLTAAIGGL